MAGGPGDDERSEDEERGSRILRPIVTLFINLLPILTATLVVSSAAGATVYFATFGLFSFYCMGLEDYVAAAVIGTALASVVCAAAYVIVWLLGLVLWPLVRLAWPSFQRGAGKGLVKETAFAVSRFIASLVLVAAVIAHLTGLGWHLHFVAAEAQNLFGWLPLMDRTTDLTLFAACAFGLLAVCVVSAMSFRAWRRRLQYWPLIPLLIFGPCVGTYVYFDLMQAMNMRINVDELLKSQGEAVIEQGDGNQKSTREDMNFAKLCADNIVIWSGSKAVVLSCKTQPEETAAKLETVSPQKAKKVPSKESNEAQAKSKEELRQESENLCDNAKTRDPRVDSKMVIIDNPENVRLVKSKCPILSSLQKMADSQKTKKGVPAPPVSGNASSSAAASGSDHTDFRKVIIPKPGKSNNDDTDLSREIKVPGPGQASQIIRHPKGGGDSQSASAREHIQGTAIQPGVLPGGDTSQTSTSEPKPKPKPKPSTPETDASKYVSSGAAPEQ